MFKKLLVSILALGITVTVQAESYSWNKLVELSNHVGARPAGSKEEIKTLNWIQQELAALGYSGTKTPFTFSYRNSDIKSANFEVVIKGKSTKSIIIVAHYDSVKNLSGAAGFLDNSSGIATLLGVAKTLQNKSLPFTTRLVFVGAEEVGLQGAKAYVANPQFDPSNFVAMVNLDTVIGGDELYIHSAHSSPYKCDYIKNPKYDHDSKVRDGLMKISKDLYQSDSHLLHPANKNYPEGVTGSWSDHAPFACSGIPIAYLEATNFAIHGAQGQDGYSQTVDPQFWTCFDEKTLAPCDRKKEKLWGMVWHTEFDQMKYFVPKHAARLQSQLNKNVTVLSQYIIEADQHL